MPIHQGMTEDHRREKTPAEKGKSAPDDSPPELAETAGSPVPAGTQVSPSAGPGRTTQDPHGNYLPADEQLLEPDQDG